MLKKIAYGVLTPFVWILSMVFLITVLINILDFYVIL